MLKDKSKKWLIDTDIGDDIDDAYALNYAVNAGLNIVGVTTVFRNSFMRAKLAKHLLNLCKAKKIPVFVGIDEPIIESVTSFQKPEKWLSQKEIEKTKGKWLPHYMPQADKSKVEKLHAVDAIIKYADKYKDNLSIIAMGPLTNLAIAIRKAPEVCKNIKEIIIMGGNVAEDIAEWNFRLDPEAAYIVLHSGISVKLIGSDITWKICIFSQEDLMDLKTKTEEKHRFLNLMQEKWQNQPIYKGKLPCMHDSLPVAAAIEHDVVKFQKMFVRVGLSGNERAKVITEIESTKQNTQIWSAVKADKEKFWNSFKKYY